ncbi:hypothetical protein ACIG3E_40800 [Streptomyces sp. NPDC053474]|uniref:hypothetical protein n=1 Tax=Streptomyces sp. NPDC053474 TaxID=3365704 RepID=UPI0037D2A5BA
MRSTRAGLREVVRADMSVARFGAGVMVVVSVVVGCFAAPIAGGLVAGGFAVLFLLVLVVMLLRGVRGVDAWQRSYVLAFGCVNCF